MTDPTMNWKGYLLVGMLEWALPIAATLVLLGPLGRGWPAAWPLARWRRWSIPVFLVTRVALPVLLYVGLGFTAGFDFHHWVHNHADRVLAGLVPGRDFPNRYGPLLPYLHALGVTIARHPVGVLIPFVIGDALAVFGGARLAAHVGGERAGAWLGTWLLLTPYLWHLLAIYAQDEALFLGALVLGALLLVERRPAWAMAALAVGLACTKATFVPYAGALFLAQLRPNARSFANGLVFAAVFAAIVGACALHGDEFGAVADLSVRAQTGVGLPVLLQRVLPLGFTTWLWIAAAGQAAAGLWFAWFCRGRPLHVRIVVVLSAVHAVTMLLLPTRLLSYEVQGLAFVLLLLHQARETRTARAALWLLPLLGCTAALFSHGANPPAFLLVQGAGTLLAILVLACASRQVAARSSRDAGST